MRIELAVLRAMLRVARRREGADEEALALRVGGTRAEVRAAIRRLEAGGLVERRGAVPPRLTMAGLALAVGLLPAASRRTARSPRRSTRAA